MPQTATPNQDDGVSFSVQSIVRRALNSPSVLAALSPLKKSFSEQEAARARYTSQLQAVFATKQTVALAQDEATAIFGVAGELSEQQNAAKTTFFNLLSAALANELAGSDHLPTINRILLTPVLCKALPTDLCLSEREIDRYVSEPALAQAKHQQLIASLPARGYLRSELVTDEQAVTASGHAVERATFLDNNQQLQTGFFKPCDYNYPPLLAKYAVAISQLYRLSLGNRHSEDRLVFDDKGQVKGTVSLALTDFTAFTHPDLQHVTTEQLINADIGAILVAAWQHGEDDAHGNNLGMVGMPDKDGAAIPATARAVKIDPDMSFYGQITAWIKGERGVHGLWLDRADEATTIKAAHLNAFPCSVGQRTYWPTFHVPGNGNVNKTYHSQAAFAALAKSPRFRQQMFFALLKSLLVFQPKTLTQKLTPLLAGQALDLDSLRTKKERANGDLGKKGDLLAHASRDLFFDEAGEERMFVEHFVALATSRHKHFYHTVVHYPPFRQYLVEHPEAMTEIKGWMVAQNKLDDSCQYDIAEAELTYQAIYRDSARRLLIDGMSALRKLIADLTQDIERKEGEGYGMQRIELSPGDDKDNAGLYLMESVADKESLLASAAVKPLFAARETLVNLQNNLVTRLERYLAFPASIASSQDFIKNCKELFTSEQVASLFANYLNWNAQFSSFRTRFLLILQGIAPGISAVAGGNNVSDYTPLGLSAAVVSAASLPDMVHEGRDAMKEWLATQKYEDIATIISKTLINKYTPAGAGSWLALFNPRAYTRVRTDEVNKAIKSVREQRASIAAENGHISGAALEQAMTKKLLGNIFVEGGWKTTSFNTLLVSELIKKMLIDFSVQPEKTSARPSLLQLRALLAEPSGIDLLKYGLIYQQGWADEVSATATATALFR